MALSKKVIIIIAAIIVIAAIGAAFMISKKPALSAQSVIIIGTTDKVTDLDPANAYDFFT